MSLLATEPTDAPWTLLAAQLRERDHDPAYTDAPVWDAYARLSFNPNTGDVEKTDRQITDALLAIERRHARLGEILRDDNKSAWKRNRKRPGWDRLIERIEGKLSQGVQAWHTDRLMRQPYDLEQLISLALATGFGVASCFGEYDLSNHDHQFQLRILTAAACKASDDTSERQKRKMAARRDRGLHAGGPRSFGFAGKDRETGEAVPEAQVAAEREAIATGSQAYVDGTGIAAIAKAWNRAGLRTVNGELHNVRNVRGVLVRAVNAGLLEHKGKIVGNLINVEPIVSQQLLTQVRAKVATRRTGRPVTGHLGSGILLCGRCGKALHSRPEKGTYPGGAPRRAYHCSNCKGVSVDQRAADLVLHDLTIERLADPAHAEQVAGRSRAVAELDGRIAEAEHTAREVGRRLADPKDAMTLDRYDIIIGPLDQALADLRARRDALLAQGVGQGPSAATVDGLEALWADESEGYADRRRALVRQAFPLGLTVAPGRSGRTFDPGRIQPIVCSR
jgi:site-specific DNA recombinase